MEKYNIFMDESGWADPTSYIKSPYFAVCGLVINDKYRNKLSIDISTLKIKYFKDKNYILHSVSLKRDLRIKKHSLIDFSKDLNRVLSKYPFFLLCTLTNKELALKRHWDKGNIFKSTYNTLIGNLVKFLIAKDYSGSIYTEACSVEQDITIYKAMITLIANGISRLGITPKDVRSHLTSVSFVTKDNNDIEEQLVDLFGHSIKNKYMISKNILDVTSLDPLDRVLLMILNKKLFQGINVSNVKKKRLYESINSFKILP